MKTRLIYFVHCTKYDNASKKCSGWKNVMLNEFPNGESLRDVEKRMRCFIEDVLSEYKGKNYWNCCS